MDVFDESERDALSWRLASELVRRHPVGVRLIRAYLGGGQSDVLRILDSTGGRGDIRLNRNGTIQVHGRFDGGERIDWKPTEWHEYRVADPRAFVQRLEAAAGLPVPSRASPATPTTLTYRVLAALAGSDRRIAIESGYIDTSGYGGGPNNVLGAFPIPDDLLRVRDDDFLGEVGYRFWIVMRDDCPLIAIEQAAGTAWLYGRDEQIELMSAYRESHRNVRSVAAELLGRIGHV